MLQLTDIRAARRGKKLTQTDMAKLLNVNRQTYSNWEAGKTKVSIEQLQTICNALELNICLLTAQEYGILQGIKAVIEQNSPKTAKNKGECGE